VPLAPDIRDWLPGHAWFEEKITLPAKFEPGEVKVDIGIVDPATNAPKVLLAIEETGDDGWHPLTSLDAR